MPHRRRARTVQSYSPDGANVHPKYTQIGIRTVAVLLPLLQTINQSTRNVGQRNGRPAEYRWRPLFNAAKFG